MPKFTYPQTGFTGIALLLLMLVLTVSISYTVSQINKPTFEKSYASEGSDNTPDSINWGSVFNAGVEALQNVINDQTANADRVINDPTSTPEQVNAAKAVKEQRAKDQEGLNKTFGKTTNAAGQRDYTERTQKIKDEWNKALEKNGQEPLPADFVPIVTNPPIVPRGTSDLERYSANKQKAGNVASTAVGGGQ